MPIAIASENSSASISGREKRHVDDEDRHREDSGNLDEQTREPAQPDLERRLGLSLDRPDRDLTERRRRPGRDDDASPGTLMHDRPHERARREVERRLARRGASLVFSTGSDSPVSTASSHSSCVTSMSRRSAGTMSPTRSATMSPGTRLVDVDRRRRAVAPDGRLVVDVAMQGGHRFGGPVLVHEAQPDAQQHDRGDDRGVRGVAREPDTAAAARSSASNGFRSCRHRTMRIVTLRMPSEFGP